MFSLVCSLRMVAKVQVGISKLIISYLLFIEEASVNLQFNCPTQIFPSQMPVLWATGLLIVSGRTQTSKKKKRKEKWRIKEQRKSLLGYLVLYQISSLSVCLSSIYSQNYTEIRSFWFDLSSLPISSSSSFFLELSGVLLKNLVFFKVISPWFGIFYILFSSALMCMYKKVPF